MQTPILPKIERNDLRRTAARAGHVRQGRQRRIARRGMTVLELAVCLAVMAFVVAGTAQLLVVGQKQQQLAPELWRKLGRCRRRFCRR